MPSANKSQQNWSSASFLFPFIPQVLFFKKFLKLKVCACNWPQKAHGPQQNNLIFTTTPSLHVVLKALLTDRLALLPVKEVEKAYTKK